jgi:LPS export ABC transporter protein LptC
MAGQALLVSLALCAAGTRETSLPPEPEGPVPRYSLEQVQHFHYQQGDLRVKVAFEHGEFFSESGELRVEKCSFVYYDSSGAPLSRGSSQRAVLFENRSRLEASRDVEIVSAVNGATLRTEHLVWEGGENRFTTEEEVLITRENGDILQGVGMVADVALNVVTIQRNVHGRIRPE